MFPESTSNERNGYVFNKDELRGAVGGKGEDRGRGAEGIFGKEIRPAPSSSKWSRGLDS